MNVVTFAPSVVIPEYVPPRVVDLYRPYPVSFATLFQFNVMEFVVPLIEVKEGTAGIAGKVVAFMALVKSDVPPILNALSLYQYVVSAFNPVLLNTVTPAPKVVNRVYEEPFNER